MGRDAAASMSGARTPVLLAEIAIAVGIAACDRSPDKSAAVKPELTPTAPSIAPPPANPAPVMPPQAAAVLETPSQTAAVPAANSAVGQPAAADQTAKGSDPKAKEPMTKEEESTAMPKPAQANDHSTTATDSKQ
jgi:hypothetical protein